MRLGLILVGLILILQPVGNDEVHGTSTEIDIISYDITIHDSPLSFDTIIRMSNHREELSFTLSGNVTIDEIYAVKDGVKNEVDWKRESFSFVSEIDNGTLIVEDLPQGEIVLHLSYHGTPAMILPLSSEEVIFVDCASEKGIMGIFLAFWYPRTLDGEFSFKISFDLSLFSDGVANGQEIAPLTFSGEDPDQMVFFMGNYTVSSSTREGTKIKSYLFSNDPGYCSEAEKIFKFHSSSAGPISMDHFWIVESPTIMGGANLGDMVLLSSSHLSTGRVDAGLLAHEIFHCWSPGLVLAPPEWGNQVTDNFATQFQYLYTESEEVNDLLSLIYTVQGTDCPLSSEDPKDALIRGQLAYWKGSAILNMLREEVGHAVYLEAIKIYYEKFAGKEASPQDFIAVCEEASGRDLSWFYDQWYNRTGGVDLILTDTQFSDGEVTGNLTQRSDYNFKVDITATDGHRSRTETFEFDGKTSIPISIPCDFTPSWVIIDQRGKLLKNPIPRKIRVGENSTAVSIGFVPSSYYISEKLDEWTRSGIGNVIDRFEEQMAQFIDNSVMPNSISDPLGPENVFIIAPWEEVKEMIQDITIERGEGLFITREYNGKRVAILTARPGLLRSILRRGELPQVLDAFHYNFLLISPNTFMQIPSFDMTLKYSGDKLISLDFP